MNKWNNPAKMLRFNVILSLGLWHILLYPASKMCFWLWRKRNVVNINTVNLDHHQWRTLYWINAELYTISSITWFSLYRCTSRSAGLGCLLFPSFFNRYTVLTVSRAYFHFLVTIQNRQSSSLHLKQTSAFKSLTACPRVPATQGTIATRTTNLAVRRVLQWRRNAT